jgi:hypothetical protein
MLAQVRSILMYFFSCLALVFGLVGILSIIKYSQGWIVTKKAVKVSSIYLTLCGFSMLLAVWMYEPTLRDGLLVGFFLIGCSTGLYYLTWLFFIFIYQRLRTKNSTYINDYEVEN